MKGSKAEGSRGARFLAISSGGSGTSSGTPNCWGSAPRAATSTMCAAAKAASDLPRGFDARRTRRSRRVD